jgi:2-amino-4-hydroxy-6-hydroxymethyldihydropteridine diphosphokinase
VSEPATLIVGLGGNVGGDGEIVERFARARASFERFGATRSARLYRTDAIGLAQPAFLNSALAVEYPDGSPAELIANVLELERALGRDRSRELRGGPRKIDLDVLIWGERVVSRADLVIPHPRLAARRFALVPIADLIGDDQVLPGMAVSVRELLNGVAGQRLELVATTW